MSERPFLNFIRSPVIWFTLVAIALVSGVFYWHGENENARRRLEREIVAADQAEQLRAREAEERRARESRRVLEEIRAQKDAEDAIRLQTNEIRQSELQKKQFVADERYVSPQQAAYQNYQLLEDQFRRDLEERKQRYDDANDLWKARQEVERQKRYLQQREYEEQAAQARREAAAR